MKSLKGSCKSLLGEGLTVSLDHVVTEQAKAPSVLDSLRSEDQNCGARDDVRPAEWFGII
jgi:hypothetical protein